MSDIDEIKRLREALEFYANTDNYWNAPLPLLLRGSYDKFTLQAVRAAEKENKVLIDNGNRAREALKPSTPATP